MESSFVPLALFDSLSELKNHRVIPEHYAYFHEPDYEITFRFLKSYQGSAGTFNSYRREIERFLHWCWGIAKKELNTLRREDIETYLHFCQKPPLSWIGTTKPPRFILKEGQRIPNSEWRPFVATVSKSAHRRGDEPSIHRFALSDVALKEILAILSTFFHFMIQEEYVFMNPVALIRQKSQFIRRTQGPPKIRRLSELQWQYVISTANALAEQEPHKHERTLFIMSCLYSMYLRISELASSPRWQPRMNDFMQDADGHWWFHTVGKGNKAREIAVSDATLESLKRWRTYLGLSRLPSPADTSPLIPKRVGTGGIQSTNVIRDIVQYCFDAAIVQLEKDGLQEDAESLLAATVHWLRHTGISDDVKRRPREHVRDDAGHYSSATTDRYINVEKRARYESAKNKVIMEDE